VLHLHFLRCQISEVFSVCCFNNIMFLLYFNDDMSEGCRDNYVVMFAEAG
jgi:hypothetical protein